MAILFYDYMKAHVEALLFANGTPLSTARLSAILDLSPEHVDHLLCLLEAEYAQSGRGLMIRRINDGFQLCTKPELGAIIEKLMEIPEQKLSQAALETLAVIAFRQPTTRQEMEAIRGVKVDGVVNTLLECGFIREVGRKEAVGRPILYGTTDEFLIHFGLRSLDDLPQLEAWPVDLPQEEPAATE